MIESTPEKQKTEANTMDPVMRNFIRSDANDTGCCSNLIKQLGSDAMGQLSGSLLDIHHSSPPGDEGRCLINVYHGADKKTRSRGLQTTRVAMNSSQ